MTPREIIKEARYIFLDTDTASLRQSDEELLLYVNGALKEASHLAPNLFFTTGDFTCEHGKTEQIATFDDAQTLFDVIRIKDGNYVQAMDWDFMNRFVPEWQTLPEGAALNWTRTAGDPLRFYIYPKSPVNQVLEVLYVKNPDEYTLDQPITELPPASKPALANYVIYRAESKDDEFVNNARALAFYNLFSTYFRPAAPQQQGA